MAKRSRRKRIINIRSVSSYLCRPTLSDRLVDDSSGFSMGQNNYGQDHEASFTKFEAFLNRASSCHNIFRTSTSNHNVSPSQSTARMPKSAPPRQIILLDDLPNILHSGTQTRFHAALQSLVTSSISNPPVPIIIIVSDAGMRGEASDERMASGGGWGRNTEGVVDIRTVIPRDLLGGHYVTQIRYSSSIFISIELNLDLIASIQ